MGRQLGLTIAFGVVLFTIIWLAPETLNKLIEYAAEGKISSAQAAWMFALHIPPVLQQTLPMAVLLGAIFTFRRISISSEWVALVSSGISPQRILMPVAAVGVLYAALLGLAQETLTPITSPQLQAYYQPLRKEQSGHFVFVEKDDAGRLQRFFFMAQTRPIQDVILLDYRPGANSVQVARILKAKTARWQPQTSSWHLEKGISYTLDAEGVYQENRQFQHLDVVTSRYPFELLQFQGAKPLELSHGQLTHLVQLLQAGGQTDSVFFYKIRLWQKWAIPTACLVFALLGALLGIEKTRARRHDGILYGAIVLFFYSVLVPVGTNLGSLGLLPPFVAAWLPLCVAVALGIGLLQRKEA